VPGPEGEPLLGAGPGLEARIDPARKSRRASAGAGGRERAVPTPPGEPAHRLHQTARARDVGDGDRGAVVEAIDTVAAVEARRGRGRRAEGLGWRARTAVLSSNWEGRMATRIAELYEEDFYAWTKEQAAALRRLEAEHWNGPLDLAHLAEQLEDLGKEQRHAVWSQLARIVEHRLKLAHSPAREPRLGWLDNLDEACSGARRRLTPAIRREIEPVLDEIYSEGRRRAARGLLAYGEQEAATGLPTHCPWTLDELLVAPPEDDLDWRP